MHLPDGILTPPVWIGAAALSTGAVALAARRGRAAAGGPAVGVLGAFVLAAQTLNVPMPGGVSVHLLGSTLLALLFGPALALPVLAAVFTLQALALGDGGVLALGFNLWNAGVVPAVAGLVVARALPGRAGAFLGGWAGAVAGALSCATGLWLAGVGPWSRLAGALAGAHAVLGVFEGALTAILEPAFRRIGGFPLEPAAAAAPAPARAAAAVWRRPIVAVLALSVGLALLHPFLTSSAPDALERMGFHAPEAGSSGPGWTAALSACALAAVAALALRRRVAS
jgi:cobalt/nickel transport system permease protein